jgi:site-specific DNA recombinase
VKVNLLGVGRLSHLTDETASPQTQENSIKSYAARKNANIVHIVMDLDVSGAVSPFERPELGTWLTDSEKMAQYDGLIVHKLDRLTRSLLDFQTLLIWRRKHGKTIISVSEGIDFSTPSGNRLANNLMMFAEFERERMRERRKERAFTDRKSGHISYGPAVVPFGYMPVRVDSHFELAPHPENKKVVAWIAEQCIAGKPASQVARYLDSRNVPSAKGGKWTSTIILTMMRNPVIKGYVVARSSEDERRTIVCGNDGMPLRRQALISDQTWEKLQAALNASSKPHSGIRFGASLLLQVAFCAACGKPLYINRRLKNGKPLGTYYRHASNDRCGQPQVRAETLEGIVEEEILRAVGDMQRLEPVAHKAIDHADQLAAAQTAINELDTEYEAYRLPASTYARMISRLEAKRDALVALPTRAGHTEYVPTDQTYREHWESLDTEGRHKFLLDASVTAYIERSEDAESLHMPDPDGRAIMVVSNGWRITIHLGNLVKLRDLAAIAD